MSIATYEFTIASFIRTLNALSNILEKGKAFADEHKLDFSVMLQTRLIPTQFHLGKQIQIATDIAKLFVPRISSIEAPKFDDQETTYEEFQARIQATLTFLKTIRPEDIQPEGKKITFPWYPGKFIAGEDYVTQYAIPNFYFHVTTAYAILRASGVPLGKQDYLAGVNWQDA